MTVQLSIQKVSAAGSFNIHDSPRDKVKLHIGRFTYSR